MPEEKGDKIKKSKSFLDIIYIFFVCVFIIIMISMLVSVWFFNWQPISLGSLFFKDYYIQSHDSRFEIFSK